MSKSYADNKPSWVQYLQSSMENNSTSTLPLDEDEKEWRKLINKEKETDITLKETYGKTILGILIGWLAFVGLLIMGKYGPNANKLSDSVLITLITTTTLDILILPKIVLQYLFPQKIKD